MVDGQDVDALDAGKRPPGVGRLHLADEDVMQRVVEGVGIDTDRVGQARLGIEVDQQDTASELGQRVAEGMDRRRLGDTPFWLATATTRATRRSLNTNAPRVSELSTDGARGDQAPGGPRGRGRPAPPHPFPRRRPRCHRGPGAPVRPPAGGGGPGPWVPCPPRRAVRPGPQARHPRPSGSSRRWFGPNRKVSSRGQRARSTAADLRHLRRVEPRHGGGSRIRAGRQLPVGGAPPRGWPKGDQRRCSWPRRPSIHSSTAVPSAIT